MSRLQMAFFELKKRVFFEIALIIGLTLSFFFAANAFGISKNEKMNSRRAEYFASFDYLKTATLFEPKRANNKYLSVDELDAIDPKAALSKHLNCFVSGADNLQTFKINPAAAELLPLYDLQEGAAYVSRRLKRYFPTGVIKLGFHSFDDQTHTESVVIAGYLDEFDIGIYFINSVFEPCDILMCGGFDSLEGCNAASTVAAATLENDGIKTQKLSPPQTVAYRGITRATGYLTAMALLSAVAAVFIDTLLKAQSEERDFKTRYILGESLGDMILSQIYAFLTELVALCLVLTVSGAGFTIASLVSVNDAALGGLVVAAAFTLLRAGYAVYRAARFKSYALAESRFLSGTANKTKDMRIQLHKKQ